MKREYMFLIRTTFDVEDGASPGESDMEGLVTSALDSLCDDLNEYHVVDNGMDKIACLSVDNVMLVSNREIK